MPKTAKRNLKRTAKARPALATRAEAAKALGIPRRALDRALERGCPPPVDGPRGTKRYDVAAIRKWLAARPQRNGNGGSHAPVSEARAALLQRQCSLADVKLAVQRGELVPAREVKRECFAIARTVRDSILNVPERVAAVIAAEPDAGRVHKILTEALTEALSTLADTLERGPA